MVESVVLIPLSSKSGKAVTTYAAVRKLSNIYVAINLNINVVCWKNIEKKSKRMLNSWTSKILDKKKISAYFKVYLKISLPKSL